MIDCVTKNASLDYCLKYFFMRVFVNAKNTQRFKKKIYKKTCKTYFRHSVLNKLI